MSEANMMSPVPGKKEIEEQVVLIKNEDYENIVLEEKNSNDDSNGSKPKTLLRTKLAIWTSHGLSRWIERIWEFSVGLILLKMYNGSLLFVSIYGLVTALGAVVLSPSIGEYLDRTHRYHGVCVFFSIQNISLLLGSGSALLLSFNDIKDVHKSVKTIGLITIVISGVFAKIGEIGLSISVEKEWAKSVCGQDNLALSKFNSSLRMIDMTCQVVAPLIAGFLMTYAGVVVSLIQILCFVTIGWFLEIILMKYAVSSSIQLQDESKKVIIEKIKDSAEDTSNKNFYFYVITTRDKFIDFFIDFSKSTKVYFSQNSSKAMFALALLYLTVLSLGILMTAYLNWLSMSEAILSIYRGLGALSGFLAAALFPRFSKCIGIHKAALFGIMIQFISLFSGCFPGYLNLSNSIISSSLVWGLIISRYGLWTFDLGITQIIQETVSEKQLGSVSGVQMMFENLFTVILYILGIIFSDPSKFQWLITGSLILYSSYYVQTFYKATPPPTSAIKF